MTEPTDAEREAFEAWAISEYLGINKSFDGSGNYYDMDTHIAWEAWQAARRTPAPVGVEPVAWSTGIAWHPDPRCQSEMVLKLTRRAQPMYGYTVPLYTTPQPTQPQAGALPLTDEQIKAMDRRHPAEDLCGWSYRLGIADAEAHHGIK